MKSNTLLKIAFGVILFHILGHTMGHFTWKDTPDAQLSGIISSMYQHEFEFMGKMQTIGGHHDGFSWLFEITLFTFAAITWVVSRRASITSELRSIVMILGVALVLCGVVELVYFFALAGGSSLVAGILLLVVYAREKSIQH